MKKILVLVFVAFSATTLFAQTESNRKLQLGVLQRIDVLLNTQFTATNLTAGFCYNEKNYVGIQIGFAYNAHTYIDSEPATCRFNAVPVVLDYIHYYKIPKTVTSLYLGMEAGALLCNYYEGGYIDSQTGKKKYDGFGAVPNICAKAGFDFRLGKPHLNVGFQVHFIGIGASAGITF